jgi:hypothetical protein
MIAQSLCFFFLKKKILLFLPSLFSHLISLLAFLKKMDKITARTKQVHDANVTQIDRQLGLHVDSASTLMKDWVVTDPKTADPEHPGPIAFGTMVPGDNQLVDIWPPWQPVHEMTGDDFFTYVHMTMFRATTSERNFFARSLFLSAKK